MQRFLARKKLWFKCKAWGQGEWWKWLKMLGRWVVTGFDLGIFN
jgi:hypothetical protein